MSKINLAGIIKESITDGPGIRFVVFCQGCSHMCQGCHNEFTWEKGKGKDVDTDVIVDAIFENKLISGVTFSGGEPFEQTEGFLDLATKIIENNKKEDRKIDIMVYTGYILEALTEKNDVNINALLDKIDYLVDGPFEIDKRDLSLKFRGSTNQRIIDMKQTRKSSKIILANEFMV